ncbi:hypothetical protein K488DRAFT_84080 [Vararia minispora EC-137]|uniref:Uncharacterized protein n=1 Tax=Vararia minispora EC-137 TaxID=1314806 RepID=A0ACB8QSE5_9AGAM|nr:hypothetical protein K488DRAFT_84080 [Vararia minispora EC-137]
MSDEVSAPLPAGNASLEVKESVLYALSFFGYGEKGFVLDIVRRIKVAEVSMVQQEGSRRKKEIVVVCEMDVEQDMLDARTLLHGGASAYLVDVFAL